MDKMFYNHYTPHKQSIKLKKACLYKTVTDLIYGRVYGTGILKYKFHWLSFENKVIVFNG